jgi:hypothetical protein
MFSEWYQKTNKTEDTNKLTLYSSSSGARGGAVVEALRYKPEGRGIDSRLFQWNFSLT